MALLQSAGQWVRWEELFPVCLSSLNRGLVKACPFQWWQDCRRDGQPEKFKKGWAESVEALLNKKEIKTEDEESDSLFNENNKGRLADEEEMSRKISEVKDMADYYKTLFGEIMYDSLMEAVEHKGYDGF